MDIRWSPRKRIKLNMDPSIKINAETVRQSHICVPARSPIESEFDPKRQSLKRVSTDFDKELDELLDQPETGFNPTQVFVEDPDMELAMLRMDIEQGPPVKRELSRRDTAPLSELTNKGTTVPSLSWLGDVKRHASEPLRTTQLVDDLEGINIEELTAVMDGVDKAGQISTQDCTQKSLERTECLFSSRCIVDQIPIYGKEGKNVGMRVTEESSGKTRYVTLSGVWLRSYMEDPWQVVRGDVIHLLGGSGKRWEEDHLVLGDSDALFPDILVLHPDVVISSTTLSASATCHRRSVIQNRVLAPQIGPPSDDPEDIARALSPIIGNCVHEAVQAAAVANNFSEEFVLNAGEEAMNRDMLPGIWSIGATGFSVLTQLRSRLKAISKWGSVEWPKTAGKLRGCEVEIRPKCLGVTGKLDMDIEDCAGARSCVEIKTGKPHAIHVGQVVLYYLLQYVEKLSGEEVSDQLVLLYLPKEGGAESVRVRVTAREAQNIMRSRNLIASHTAKRSLPDPIMKKGDCQFCPSRTECAALYRGDEKKFFDSLRFTRRSNISIGSKREVVSYQQRWLDWIDLQPTVDAIGGLSAVRRMRGNLLHMTAHALLTDSQDPFFFNWMPVLIGNAASADLASIGGFNPKNKVGRALGINLALFSTESALRVLRDLIEPAFRRSERVLICASGHDKLDLMMEQCMHAMIDIDKIARIASKTSNVKDLFLLPEDWMMRIDEIDKSTRLFACTIKGVHHDLLSRGDFNFAIVLDAHKVPDALLWGVLLRSRQVVLVGDSSTRNESDPNECLFNRIAPAETWKAPEQHSQQLNQQNDTVVVIED